MTATRTTVAGLMKEVYEDRLTKQFNEEIVALKRIEGTSRGVTSKVGGHYVDFPIMTGRPQSTGYRHEREALMAAGHAEWTDVHIPLKYGYHRGALTGQVMKLAEKDYQAFASTMRKEMDASKEAVVKDANRIAYGDGTGALATIDASTGPALTASVYDPLYLEEGMLVDIKDSAGVDATGGNSAEIVSVVLEADGTGTVTFAANVTVVADDDAIYREDNFTDAENREPNGFDAIVAAGELYNVDSADFGRWQGVVEQGATPGTPEALSESRMITLCDRVRRNGGKTSVIFTSLGVRRAYFNLLVADRQFHNTKTFDGGFVGLPFNYGREIAVVEDVDAPRNKMWFIDESKMTVYRESPWHFADEDGSTLKYVTGFDEWEYVLRQFWEIGTDQRGAHGVLEDITEA